MNQQLQELTQKFYALNETENKQVLDGIAKWANEDKASFIKYVDSQPLGIDSQRAIFYEALMEAPYGWEEFYLVQIETLISHAENGNKEAESEISSIYYLTNNNGLKSEFYEQAINYFEHKLNSISPIVRQAALENIIALHEEGKKQISLALKRKLQSQLKDKDFKTRQYAFLNLKDDKMLPTGFVLKFMDKLRMKLNV